MAAVMRLVERFFGGDDAVGQLRDLAHRADRRRVGFAGGAGGDDGEEERQDDGQDAHPPDDAEEEVAEDDASAAGQRASRARTRSWASRCGE